MFLYWFLTMLASRDPKSSIVCRCIRIYPTWNSLICPDTTKWDRKWYSHVLPQHHFSRRCTFSRKIHFWDSWWVTTKVLVWLDNLISYVFFPLNRCTEKQFDSELYHIIFRFWRVFSSISKFWLWQQLFFRSCGRLHRFHKYRLGVIVCIPYQEFGTSGS